MKMRVSQSKRGRKRKGEEAWQYYRLVLNLPLAFHGNVWKF